MKVVGQNGSLLCGSGGVSKRGGACSSKCVCLAGKRQMELPILENRFRYPHKEEVGQQLAAGSWQSSWLAAGKVNRRKREANRCRRQIQTIFEEIRIVRRAFLTNPHAGGYHSFKSEARALHNRTQKARSSIPRRSTRVGVKKPQHKG
jgi:hypothetical protein